jgi:hypothetical protein
MGAPTARTRLDACRAPRLLLSNLHICIRGQSLLIREPFEARVLLRYVSWQPWAARVLTSEYCVHTG